jgi:hypothetical protein
LFILILLFKASDKGYFQIVRLLFGNEKLNCINEKDNRRSSILHLGLYLSILINLLYFLYYLKHQRKDIPKLYVN